MLIHLQPIVIPADGIALHVPIITRRVLDFPSSIGSGDIAIHIRSSTYALSADMIVHYALPPLLFAGLHLM